MILSEIFKYLDSDIYKGYENIEINNLHYDSRKIEEGDLFVALKGAVTDAHQYIDAVLKKGAFVLAQKGLYNKENKNVFFCEDSREALALVSKAFFKDPDEKLKLIGITGTNGKTTTTYMIRSILKEAGLKTGIIGTIHHLIGDKVKEAKNTTPESYDIYEMLSLMQKEGCKAAAVEISSHALEMHRAQGLALDAAIFTNLTQDHLDYHETLEKYLQAKLKIFDLLKSSTKTQKSAFINADIEQFSQIKEYIQNLNLNYKSYGIKQDADWQCKSVKMNISHNIFEIHHENENYKIDTPMLGGFNLYNASAAVSCCNFLGASKAQCEKGLESVKVNGRFEPVKNSLGFAVIIDYAHTHDALENVLNCAKALKPKKIITVFGAGGDRDKKKRPLMGSVSKKLSDYSIITSDNPRSEDPDLIIKDIEVVFDEKSEYLVEADREKAIEKAIKLAQKGDLILIAGKGHEDYQIFKDKTIHFSDRETAEKYLKKRA